MKRIFQIINALLIFSLLCITGCQERVTNNSNISITTTRPQNTQIAFFLINYNNITERTQLNEAKKYAQNKYKVDLIENTDSQNINRILEKAISQEINMASLYTSKSESMDENLLTKAQSKGTVLNSYMNSLGNAGIPVVKSDEYSVSFEMGKEMAEQWKKVQPDKPIVMVQFGYPNRNEYKANRTDAFVKGVQSIDSTAKNKGAVDISVGSEAVKDVCRNLLKTNPNINLIYSEDPDITKSILSVLNEAGRGKFTDGRPLTEIVCSAECNNEEISKIYDPNCSLKLSLGLLPIEIAHARIDNLFDIKNGKIKQKEQPAKEIKVKANCISFWTTKEKDAKIWYDSQYKQQ